MASQEGSASFESLIHADRARKKNEDLANQIFGRAKSNQNIKKQNKEPRSPSLASRMGIQKRTSSTSTPTQKNPFNPPSRPSSTTPSHSFRNSRDHRDSQSSNRASRIANEIDTGNANISSSRNNSFNTSNVSKPANARNGTPQQGPGLSIKGSAGPFTVQLSNFAPGTTEADIEAAMQPELLDESGNNSLQACRLLSTRPSVMAEMVFAERTVAVNIVNKFNNLKADGRILKVEIVRTGPSRDRDVRATDNGNNVPQAVEQSVPAQESAVESSQGDMDMDEVEINTDFPSTTAYDHEREAADRDRRDRDRNRDGYGGRRDDGDRNQERDRDRRDDRDRGDRDRRREDDVRNRDREQERDRERDGRDRRDDRDRNYDRQESQPQQGYNDRPSGPPPPPGSYANGFSRPSRGYGYGGPRGYGFPRGGYGGRGGGYRGYGR